MSRQGISGPRSYEKREAIRLFIVTETSTTANARLVVTRVDQWLVADVQ